MPGKATPRRAGLSKNQVVARLLTINKPISESPAGKPNKVAAADNSSQSEASKSSPGLEAKMLEDGWRNAAPEDSPHSVSSEEGIPTIGNITATRFTKGKTTPIVSYPLKNGKGISAEDSIARLSARASKTTSIRSDAESAPKSSLAPKAKRKAPDDEGSPGNIGAHFNLASEVARNRRPQKYGKGGANRGRGKSEAATLYVPEKCSSPEVDSPKRKSTLMIPVTPSKNEPDSPYRKGLDLPSRGSSRLRTVSPEKKRLKFLQGGRDLKMEDTPEEPQRVGLIIPDVFTSSFDHVDDEEETSPLTEAKAWDSRRSSTSTLTEMDSQGPMGPVCPMCNQPVDQELLEDFKKKHPRMTLQQEQRFCQSHKKKSARETWHDKGYPDIEWSSLDRRISKKFSFLRGILEGDRSHFGDIFSQKVRIGQNKTLLKSEANLTPGYYGIRGLRAMSEAIIREFSSLLRKRAVQDRLVSARGHTAYVQAVLVPELTVRLVMEDMDVGEEEAQSIMADSIWVGELLNEEVADVVMSDDDSSSLSTHSLSDSEAD